MDVDDAKDHDPGKDRMSASGPSYISSLPGPGRAPGFPRKLVILGCTGSIGESALAVVEEHPEMFEILALAGGRNAGLLARQAARWRPSYLAVLTEEAASELRGLLPSGYSPDILIGPAAYPELAALTEAELVLSAIVGAAGLPPTMAAAQAGKMIALANKESLVLAGDLIREACRESGASILPVDSEHNALFQALGGHGLRDLPECTALILTASGGPFRQKDAAFLETVTAAQALNHPNWSMGPKITIDSATLMNKGLEVIEACRLYGMPPSMVKVAVHPQSIVHSLAQFHDGSILAHLGPPDMRIAIAYCLAYPERAPLSLEPVDLVKLGALTFEAAREDVFPCLALAREALLAGPSHTVVLNAANEAAVELFLAGKLSFPGIPAMISRALERHQGVDVTDLDAILELDRETRNRSRSG